MAKKAVKKTNKSLKVKKVARKKSTVMKSRHDGAKLVNICFPEKELVCSI